MKQSLLKIVTMNSSFHSADVQTISENPFFGPLKTTHVLCMDNGNHGFHDWRFFFSKFPHTIGKICLQ